MALALVRFSRLYTLQFSPNVWAQSTTGDYGGWELLGSKIYNKKDRSSSHRTTSLGETLLEIWHIVPRVSHETRKHDYRDASCLVDRQNTVNGIHFDAQRSEPIYANVFYLSLQAK